MLGFDGACCVCVAVLRSKKDPIVDRPCTLTLIFDMVAVPSPSSSS